ncbi:EF hand [Onchocerca flexuosa]|uniref:EF hand n=1 Tax=Onchocerca flexuosa TaxID=387005 RepID=A0A238C3Y1_9BILA|nr:EF hand [Onchocerca flexuosa]
MMNTTPRNSKRFSGRQKAFLSNPPSSRASIIAGAIKHKFHHDFNQRLNSGTNAPLLKAKLAGYSQEELEEYYQVFNVFDTDGSGAIGIDELESAMRNLGLEPQKNELEQIIEEVDQMGNHEIDFHEFCDVMKRMSDKQNSWNDVTRECFVVFDRSEVGVISKKDFQYILNELGDIRDKAVVDDIFAEADVDGDGVLDYDEFTFMVRNYMNDEDLATCKYP